MQHAELTEKIIACAFRVHNTMGFGFLEAVYERCMLIELRKAGLRAEGQQAIEVRYEGELVGEYAADLVVEDAVILELKSVRSLAPAHETQLVHYLTATGLDVGLLINFGPERVDVRRKVRQLPENMQTG